jgi:hypothetical protein
MKIAYL